MRWWEQAGFRRSTLCPGLSIRGTPDDRTGIVKNLVELHGGTVRAKSGGVGKGATFIVSLPLTLFHPPPEEGKREHPKSKSHQLPVPPTVSLEAVRVLAVDDDADARNLLRVMLQSAGATVYLANSAKEGMEQLLSRPVDVLICDDL